ncbi:hypothetical protein POM88_033586 [Heracleum sosnowskyi]|uniref:Uncharacterized protein n=1 Tax=Heracleum sosnowskyi TaxID=360622 RepID=A0AAD8HHY5_9APIA|nr:hypothetical protein POM88_033586 [Heracleum sosnowskyi]
MSVDRNFQQIWGFRGGDDDIDSSSDDSKSGEANHKLASVVLPVNDETSDDLDHQKIDKVEPDGEQPRKPRIKKRVTAKAKGKKRKTENAFKKEVGKKKRKSNALNSAILDELKIFTVSIIQDLKVEREQMFAQMKEEMQNLVSVKSSTRQTAKTKGRQKSFQTRNTKNTKSERRPRNIRKEHVKCDQAAQTISLNKKEKGGHVRLLAEQPMYSYTQSANLASSAYLTLPSAPSEKQLEHQNTESPYGNCLKPGNGTGLSFASGHGNVTMNAMNHCGYISGSHMEVPFPSFAQMGSKNTSFSDQHCTQTSSMGNVFPLPLHQRFENYFNIPSQVGNISRDNNILGWRMNGGNIIFSGNGNSLPDNFASNMVLNRIHYRPNGNVTEYGIQDIRDGNLN